LHLLGNFLWTESKNLPHAATGVVSLVVVYASEWDHVSLFMLDHQFNHNTPFAHRNLNVGIGYVCGLVQLLPFHRPWHFHLEHHNLPEYHADVDRHLDNAR
jgi:fatty acid desaturase|tara:strand:+ start:169 stop:471 length:303 start_codon:yes stop_codon:yes gene_type:complete